MGKDKCHEYCPYSRGHFSDDSGQEAQGASFSCGGVTIGLLSGHSWILRSGVQATASEPELRIMSGRDLRKAIRYQLAVRVSFCWRGADRCLHESHGVTRNISSEGVLIAADRCPLPGEIIDVGMLLPRSQGGGHGMRVHGKGAVLRVEPRLDGAHECVFAVCAHWYPQRGGAWSGDLRGWLPNEATNGYCN